MVKPASPRPLVPRARPAARRRTQEERSATTRARLLDATIETLVRLGYAGTTTTEVARRAGVSRGAELHHFPTRAALVVAAIDRLYARHVEEFKRAFRAIPDAPDAAAIDLLWEIFSGPTFYAALELETAARTDAELKAGLAPIARRLRETVLATARELFPDAARSSASFDPLIELVFNALSGMAMARIVRGDADTPRQLEFLKTLAAGAIEGERE